MAQTTRTRARMCLFWYFLYGSPFKGSKTKKKHFGGVNRRFQAKLAKSNNLHIIKTTALIFNQILHNDKDHQMPFVDGPNTGITNPRWRTAAILEKSKNHISVTVRAISTKFSISFRFVAVNSVYKLQYIYFTIIMPKFKAYNIRCIQHT